MKGNALLFLALVTSMLLNIFIMASVSAQSTTIGVEPESIVDPALVAGSTFAVEIWIRNVSDLAGLEFKLSYDISVLNATLIDYGGIFGVTYLEMVNKINYTEGWLHYSVMEYFGEPSFYGDGRAAIINFTVISYGKSFLNLYETKLGDSALPPNPIDHTIINGYFRNMGAGDVNADGLVDIFDVNAVSAHWYPGPPEGPLGYDPDADLNLDGAVDIFDIGIVSDNWGNTYP